MKTPAATEVTTSAPSKRKFSHKSTSTEAQRERLIDMLRIGLKNTMELRRGGVMMPAARVKELKDKYGYCIPTVDRVTITDEWGFTHPRVAIYELVSEPGVA